jgi:Fe-S cluster assembly protein SufD
VNSESQFPASDTLINSICFIHLDQNAIARHIKWQELPLYQNLVYKLFVTQQRDSRFETFAFDQGGQLVRNNVEIELEEPNTYTSLQAGYLATGHQSMDHQTRINHKVPHCESHELYKGIIDDQATGAFNGKVLVHKDAQKTNAFQQNDTLVLSKNALMNSKPQLEIFADDVKCSHGATIGQLDEKAMFYLKSRGLREESAKHMLKKAFISEVLDKVHNEAMRNYISSQMGITE